MWLSCSLLAWAKTPKQNTLEGQDPQPEYEYTGYPRKKYLSEILCSQIHMTNMDQTNKQNGMKRSNKIQIGPEQSHVFVELRFQTSTFFLRHPVNSTHFCRQKIQQIWWSKSCFFRWNRRQLAKLKLFKRELAEFTIQTLTYWPQ